MPIPFVDRFCDRVAKTDKEITNIRQDQDLRAITSFTENVATFNDAYV